MKPPPFLLGATLLFWGWQTNQLIAGAIMAAVLESARWIKTRWEFTDQDFRRIWIFCALLFMAVALYAFTSSGGPADFVGFVQNPNPATGHNVSAASTRAVAVWLRSLPMVFILFIAAQTFNAREGIPPETISLLMHWRWQRARELGQASAPAPNVNVSFAYFAVCLFAATFRTLKDSTFFWGLCALLAWAFWSLRSRRFSLVVWAGALGTAMLLGYGGQIGLGKLYGLIESHYAQWLSRAMGGGARPSQSETALGHIGRLKTSGKIVLRLEPKAGSRPPALLREASYRTYKTEFQTVDKTAIWYADVPQDAFEAVNEETNQTTWILLPGKTNSLAVNLACYLHGGNALLPLPTGSGRLEHLSAFTLQKSRWGTSSRRGPAWSFSMPSTGPVRPLTLRAIQTQISTFPPERPTRSTRSLPS